MTILRVLFVCVENSCRSQIAEAYARKLGADWLAPDSAGSRPSGQVNPMAIEVMRERGFDLSVHKSKAPLDLPAHRWDAIVTMGCGDACPNVPAKRRFDWQIPDPKNLPKDKFHEVCDLIEARVRALLNELKPS